MRAFLVYFQLLFFGLLIASCSSVPSEHVTNRPKRDTTPSRNITDSHSYSNIHQIRTSHIHLDFDVNFDNHSIYGVARHEMENFGADTAIFDIKGLEIQKVTVGQKDEKTTDFVIGEQDELLGQALSVKISPTEKFINIYYKTTDKTEAIDWLAPELTAGKKSPFMYTQGQAILTRSWIPLQDTPANRITYSANVQVPSGLMAVMSAENPTEKSEDGKYHFEMNQPIPCYLIALAIGDLTYKKLGENCGVYSEPELIQKCAYEFVDLPKMITAAEKLYGKYQWEQYDVIVLPYSFPFGGMENPRLTFANPTLLAGDRSLVSVIAHELAHSWSGNLVTNATWNDFWLNEGFTVYFENRIMEEIYGVETADMLALIEFQELGVEMADMERMGRPEDTHLKLGLDGRSPDDGMNSIAYVKGAFFLKTLEKAAGRKAFDKFLNGYFTTHAFQTITTESFESYLYKNLLTPNHIKFNTKEWLYAPGLPSNCVKITSQRFQEVQALADDFANGKDIFKKTKKSKTLTRDKYITQEWQAFIRRLPSKIDPKLLKQLDDNLNFKNWGNSEIMAEWYVLGINSGYKSIRPDMERFLKKVGRRKFLAPIYKTLTQNSDDLAWAKRVFEQAKGNYHFVSRSTIQEMLYPVKEKA